ncbi:phosphatase PAP2 family protein [archaeon]|nr:phosphatase PAP2 family protein [archaeon]
MIEKLLSLHNPILDKIMFLITNIGDKITIALFSLILIIFLLNKKEYIKTKIVVLSLGLGIVLSQGLKYLIQKPRPETMTFLETGYSFPSGHSTMSIIFFGLLIYLFKDEIKNKSTKYIFIILNILIILLIGFSRLYFNVHYVIDVLGGYMIGFICLLSSIILVRKIPFLNKNKLI